MYVVHSLNNCLFPYKIIFFLYKIYSLDVVKYDVHLAPHDCLINSYNPDDSFGNTCVCVALGSRPGIFMLATCIGVMVCLLGNRASMPFGLRFILMIGMLVCT